MKLDEDGEMIGATFTFWAGIVSSPDAAAAAAAAPLTLGALGFGFGRAKCCLCLN